MRIGAREVGPGLPAFVIAEIGSNHGGSLDRALALIDAAADAGADAAKFQYFRVDRFLVPRVGAEGLRRYELPDAWLGQLKRRCTARKIEFLCTAFDLQSLEVIDGYVDAHKVGSYEVGSADYLAAVERKGKPIIASNGVRSPDRWINASPNRLIVLQCVSEYPAPIAGYLAEHPRDPWGVSDHTTNPTIVPAAAAALGACVIEKHMTVGISIPRDSEFPDFPVSISRLAFRDLVEAVRLTESAIRG